LAEKIIKGVTCPACGGEQDMREGVRTFNCKYCGTLLVTKGVDGPVKYYVPNNLQRNIAIQNTFHWLGKGFSKARGLKTGSKLDEAFLVYIPYWRVRADVIGWVFGQEKKTRTVNNSVQTYYVDVEKKILQTYDRTYAACDVAELGVRTVNLAGDKMLPVNFEKEFVEEAVRTAKVDRITFQHHDLVRPGVNIVYYPLWVVRYIFQGRTYQVVVDGEDGSICYGKAPGNNLYRAVVGIFGTALGSFFITLFGVFGLAGDSSSSGKGVLAVYIFCIIIGIALIKWAYKKFRYGGEVEEGTGIIKEVKKSSKKSSAVLSAVEGSLSKSDVVNIAASFLRK
jgi:hypothetical protein